MKEWDLMTEIAKANNQSDDKKLASLIVENDFTDKPRAVTIALSSFQITKENIAAHSEAAKKLVALPQPEAFREALRQELLTEMLQEVVN